MKMKINKIEKINKTQKKKVAAYVRVSTLLEEQEESFSLQKEFFENYIKSIDEFDFVGIYADEGKSGLSTNKRLNFLRMINDALNHKIDIILCKSISRFGRNSAEVQEYIHILKTSMVEVRFLKENLSSFNAQSEVVFNFMAAISEEQARSISENVKWSYLRLAKQGIRHIGNNRVIGYDEINGILTPNKDAWIPKLIFEEFANGKSINQIIKLLENKKAKRIRSNKSFSPSNITYILSNEIYVGDRKLQKKPHIDYKTKKPIPNSEYESYYIYHSHKAIITQEIFNKVQTRLKQIEERKKQGIYSSSNEHFMHGKLFCGECGMPLTRRTMIYHSKKQKVWKCKGRINDYKSCHNDVISEEDLFKEISKKQNIKWTGIENITQDTYKKINKVIVIKSNVKRTISINIY